MLFPFFKNVASKILIEQHSHDSLTATIPPRLEADKNRKHANYNISCTVHFTFLRGKRTRSLACIFSDSLTRRPSTLTQTRSQRALRSSQIYGYARSAHIIRLHTILRNDTHSTHPHRPPTHTPLPTPPAPSSPSSPTLRTLTLRYSPSISTRASLLIYSYRSITKIALYDSARLSAVLGAPPHPTTTHQCTTCQSLA